MKRILIPISILIASCALGANVVSPANDVLVRNLTYGGTNCTGTELTNIIAMTSDTQKYRFIFDTPWDVTNASASVSFKTNISLLMLPGSYFNVSPGVVMTFASNSLDAGTYPIFTGAGTATGSCYFIYRWPEWGNVNRFRIGDGIYQGVSPAGNFTSITGTSLRVNGPASITGDLDVGGDLRVTSNLWANAGRLMTLVVSNTANFLGNLYGADGYFNNVTVSNTTTLKGPTTIANTAGTAIDMVKQATTNIYLSTNMTQAAIQAKLDSLKRDFQYGAYANIYFSNGTYVVTNEGFHVEGIKQGYVFLNGNTGDAEYVTGYVNVQATNSDGHLFPFSYTNQGVVIDGSALPANQATIQLTGYHSQFRVSNMKVFGGTNGDARGAVWISGGDGQCSAYVMFNFIEGLYTNAGAGIYCSGQGWYRVNNNRIRKNLYGIWSDIGAGVESWENDEYAGDLPKYGMNARGTAYIACIGTNQVDGITADILETYSGHIYTNTAASATQSEVKDYVW